MSHAYVSPEQRAHQVLEQAKAEFLSLGESWSQYTIDVELIATLLFNLGIQRVPTLRAGQREYAAFLDPGALLIAVEAHHHLHRQRFSIAHEIGHFVLHVLPQPTAAGFFRCSTADMEVSAAPAAQSDRALHLRREWEANLFASELLMPAQPLLAMFRTVGGRVSALARHFNVSSKAMEIRLSRLQLPFPPLSR